MSFDMVDTKNLSLIGHEVAKQTELLKAILEAIRELTKEIRRMNDK